MSTDKKPNPSPAGQTRGSRARELLKISSNTFQVLSNMGEEEENEGETYQEVKSKRSKAVMKSKATIKTPEPVILKKKLEELSEPSQSPESSTDEEEEEQTDSFQDARSGMYSAEAVKGLKISMTKRMELMMINAEKTLASSQRAQDIKNNEISQALAVLLQRSEPQKTAIPAVEEFKQLTRDLITQVKEKVDKKSKAAVGPPPVMQSPSPVTWPTAVPKVKKPTKETKEVKVVAEDEDDDLSSQDDSNRSQELDTQLALLEKSRLDIDSQADHFQLSLLLNLSKCPECHFIGMCNLFCTKCDHNKTTKSNREHITPAGEVNPEFTTAVRAYEAWKKQQSKNSKANSHADYFTSANITGSPKKYLNPKSDYAATPKDPTNPFKRFCHLQGGLADLPRVDI